MAKQESSAQQGLPDSVVLRERKRWGFLGLPFTFTTYTLTGNKLVLHRGLFTSTEDDMLLYRVMDISLRRTLWQKMFGLASLVITSSDKSHPSLQIHNIRRFRVFKNELDDRVQKDRIRMRTRTSEMMGVDFDGQEDLETTLYS